MKNVYFSTNLKYLREKKKWKQNELADKLNVTEQVVSHWENGRREPGNMEMVGKIAELFDVNEDLIFKDLRIEEKVELDENTKINNVIMDNVKELTLEDKQMLLGMINVVKNNKPINNKGSDTKI